MTPKEKAKQLVDKFIPMTKDWDQENGYFINEGNAIDCALIAVDEVLNFIHTDAFSYTNEEYWVEVKQEIQKL